MKYCQGPKCHEYTTKDRIRGSKGDKHYETRKRSSFWYGKGNFCDQRCMYDWIDKHIEHGLDHFGRVHEPKRVGCDSAWYKDYTYRYDHTNNRSNNIHYFVNDLLGERRPITQQQYDDTNLTQPS
jgi:hypothetical protein